MKRRNHKKIKISKIIVIILGLIFFLTFFWWQLYTEKAGPKITLEAETKLKKFTTNFLSNSISYDILNDNNLSNILIINKNEDGEILYVDYNLDKAYEALEIVTNVIYEKISDLEEGDFKDIKDEDIISTDEGLMLKVPFFIGSNSPLVASFGPPIFVKVDFIGTVLTNIKSKITDYGFNNALVELFVTIEINERLTTPVLEKEIAINYDVLVASKVINGRVPEFYGDILNTKSSDLDIPIQN